MNRSANRQGAGVLVDGNAVEMAKIHFDPVLDRSQTCRVAMPAAGAEKRYVVMVSVLDLFTQLLAADLYGLALA